LLDLPFLGHDVWGFDVYSAFIFGKKWRFHLSTDHLEQINIFGSDMIHHYKLVVDRKNNVLKLEEE